MYAPAMRESNLVPIKRKDRRLPRRPPSPYAASRELGVSWPLFKRAIDLGEVKTATFGGRMFIPTGEMERLRALVKEW